jgi:hypothetical protein
MINLRLPPVPKADAIAVLGCTRSARLQRRIERGVRFYQEGVAPPGRAAASSIRLLRHTTSRQPLVHHMEARAETNRASAVPLAGADVRLYDCVHRIPFPA